MGRPAKSKKMSTTGICNAENFRIKARKFNRNKSCLFCIFYILFTRIFIFDTKEPIFPDICLISTVSSKNSLFFSLFRHPNFRIGQQFLQPAVVPVASFCRSGCGEQGMVGEEIIARKKRDEECRPGEEWVGKEEW